MKSEYLVIGGIGLGAFLLYKAGVFKLASSALNSSNSVLNDGSNLFNASTGVLNSVSGDADKVLNNTAKAVTWAGNLPGYIGSGINYDVTNAAKNINKIWDSIF